MIFVHYYITISTVFVASVKKTLAPSYFLTDYDEYICCWISEEQFAAQQFCLRHYDQHSFRWMSQGV